MATEVANASQQGIEVAIVVGGGNYFRGANAWEGLDRATADNMGMLATCMNAICLQVDTSVTTASWRRKGPAAAAPVFGDGHAHLKRSSRL